MTQSNDRVQVRPGPGTESPRRVPLAWMVAGLCCLLLLTPFGSRLPDGLEFAAERLGMQEKPVADAGLPTALAPDYTIAGLGEGGPSKVVAGLAGVALMLLLGRGLICLLTRPSPLPPDHRSSPSS